MFRTYARALDYLNRFTDYERMSAPYSPGTYNLDRMRELAEALGRPDREFKSLHVAGTKGKGSVAHMAEAILRESGYRTGLYVSPHLVDMRERIQLQGRPMAERDFVWAMNRMGRHLRRLRPTYFETMTAAAFLLFARRRVEYAVIEVGLGGRLDATNVITPVACAITTIDYDHMEKLGRTLARIASEKAGIIKPGVPVVISPQRPEALREIRRRAEPLRPRFRVLSARPFVLKFTVAGPSGRDYGLCRVRTLGRHQAANAATAVGLVEASGAEVAPAAVRRALARVRLPGRLEAVARRPWVVVDAAHNPVAARATAVAVRGLRRRRLVLVFGASADKDVGGMLRSLLPEADVVVFTRARSPRAADPEELAARASGPALVAGTVGEALELARTLASPEDAILVTGSFYVAGEALAALK